MRSTREIVTIQLGGGANFAGAHFWNLQQAWLGDAQDGDAADPHVLLRERSAHGGRGGPGTTSFVPRLVSLDLSGTVRTGFAARTGSYVPRGNGVIDTWGGPSRVALPDADPEPPPPEFSQVSATIDPLVRPYVRENVADPALPIQRHRSTQDADGSSAIQYWDDALGCAIDDRSVRCLEGVWHGASSFDGFGDGAEHFARGDARDAVFDAIRRQTEACDHLQGIALVADDLTGFGAVGGAVVRHLRDDVTSQPVLSVGLRGPLAQDYCVQEESVGREQTLCTLNEAMTTATLAAESDAHVILDVGAGSSARHAPHGLFFYAMEPAAVLDSLLLGAHASRSYVGAPLPNPSIPASSDIRAIRGAPRGLGEVVRALRGSLKCPLVACGRATLPSDNIGGRIKGLGLGGPGKGGKGREGGEGGGSGQWSGRLRSLTSAAQWEGGAPPTGFLAACHIGRGLASLDPQALQHSLAQSVEPAWALWDPRQQWVAQGGGGWEGTQGEGGEAGAEGEEGGERGIGLGLEASMQTCGAHAGFAASVGAVAASFRKRSRAAMGVRLLSRWGMAPGDVDEIANDLDTLAASYRPIMGPPEEEDAYDSDY